MLAWIDLETTGLDSEKDHILEVACVITDDNLVETARFVRLVAPPDDFDPKALDPVVVKMHTDNGLFAELLMTDPVLPVRKVDHLLAFFLATQLAGEHPPMCGSTVSFDRRFLERQMPQAASLFHYRNVDVSSIKELCKRWRPDLEPLHTDGHAAHRALDDILQSIQTLRNLRGVFIDPMYSLLEMQPAQPVEPANAGP